MEEIWQPYHQQVCGKDVKFILFELNMNQWFDTYVVTMLRSVEKFSILWVDPLSYNYCVKTHTFHI